MITLCFFDGSCGDSGDGKFHNPGGEMGIGAVVFWNIDIAVFKSIINRELLSETILHRDCDEISYSVPPHNSNSNNVSEYMAVIEVMKLLNNNNDKISPKVYILGDSRLVIEQLNGYWKIKQGRYKKYALEAKEMIKPSYRFLWIPREYNGYADILSKQKDI
jgi:ribonuclease HI